MCLPTTTNPSSKGVGVDPGAQDNDARRATMVEGVPDSMTPEGQSGARGGVDGSIAWRVLPLRLAISLRLERLAPSRPPRPSRLASTAPTGPSVSRLRLSIKDNILFRASHAGLLLPRQSLLNDPSTAVVVGWNGHDDTVGSLSEYDLSSTEASSGLENDLLLAVPEHGRSALVLTVTVVKRVSRAREGYIAKGDERGTARITLGTVTIGWDGLSCVHAYDTDYFVDPMDGRSSSLPHLRPMAVNLELVAPKSEPHQHTTSSPRDTGTALALLEASKVNGGMYGGGGRDGGIDNRCQQISGCRTAGFSIWLNLQLEQSPTNIPYALSLSPVAAGGSSSLSDVTPIAPASVSLGDFRDPSRRERIPYLQFAWPWDDQRETLIERRRCRVPSRPWRLPSLGDGEQPGRHHQGVVTWPNAKETDNEIPDNGTVSIHLPLVMSALDGNILLRPGNASQQLWTNLDSGTTESVVMGGANEGGEAGCDGRTGPTATRPVYQQQPAIVFVEAYDMGTYAPSERQAAMIIQHLWRRALEGLLRARLWWEWDGEVCRYNAAVRVQACYRGWEGRRRVQEVKRQSVRRGVAAVTIQCQWRCVCDVH